MNGTIDTLSTSSRPPLAELPERGDGTEAPFLRQVRLRARRRVLWLRRLWASGLAEAEQGMAIPHSEVDRILNAPEERAAAEAAFYATDPEALRLGQEIEAADRCAADDAAWKRLCGAFALSGPERDLLALAVAAEVNPLLRRAYGYLHDDVNACWPSPWLAASLFAWPPGLRIGPESALARWRLAYPMAGAPNPWSQTAPWAADPYIVTCLTQGIGPDPALGTSVQRIAKEEMDGVLCLFQETRDAILAFLQALRRETSAPIEIELIGPAGAGKRTLAAQIAAALGADLLAADTGALLGPDASLTAEESVTRAVRMARLCGAVLYWHNASGGNPRLWETASGFADLVIFGEETPLAQRAPAGSIRRAFRLPCLTRQARTALWERLADLPIPAPITNWALTPGEIARAAQAAPAGLETVVELCRQSVHQEPGELFTPLVCPYTWDDIVLSPGVRRHLAEFEAQARLRGPVYDAWGFGRLCPLGRGISALFAGPSGTGKTMAAQVLARALDIELYRVDLAGVMNKYIGETEKRLKRVFDACERANVLLFFDEADALFGQRTQVKDAHDRFANIEIDYLLQRMEQYEGIAVLATNRKSDLDTAFLRRLRFLVDFVPPGPAERLAIWQRVLPAHAPDGTELRDQIDWEFLANRLSNMTGADIKNAALGAAFLARADWTRIGMRHILAAARREMAKHGVVIRPGEWEARDDGGPHH